jgi:hypothetical protein
MLWAPTILATAFLAPAERSVIVKNEPQQAG